MAKDTSLIIFAKAPVPGQVKTRLLPRLSPDECAGLHKSFIIDTITLAKKVKGPDVYLACHPWIDHPFFQSASSEHGIGLIPQKGEDLGERMDNAVRKALSEGYGKVVIIGSDSPDLPPLYIEDAFKRLDSSDMVIGPSRDGGYYLIGGNRELPVFEGIPWGSDKVFMLTMESVRKEGIGCHVLDEWYDVDTWEDLQALLKRKSKEL